LAISHYRRVYSTLSGCFTTTYHCSHFFIMYFIICLLLIIDILICIHFYIFFWHIRIVVLNHFANHIHQWFNIIFITLHFITFFQRKLIPNSTLIIFFIINSKQLELHQFCYTTHSDICCSCSLLYTVYFYNQ